jgi:hypothetical protein
VDDAAIVDVLIARGLAVDDDLRISLAGVSDLDLLRRLLRRAVTAGSAAEVLAALKD